jgi:hypothetical protein
MKISLIDNGLDSLRKGYIFLRDYEKLNETSGEDTLRFLVLKDAILSIQHGVEILFKCLLTEKNEVLLFDEINHKLREAFKKRRNGEIEQLYEAEGVHTVSYRESIDRVNDICGIDVDNKFRKHLSKLEAWRNGIIHSAVVLNEREVSSVLTKLMPELDAFFGSALGEKYIGGQGRHELERAFRLFTSVHGEHTNKTKASVIASLIYALKENNLKDITSPGVFKTSEPEKALSILQSIQEGGVTYGADFVNLHCSGASRVLGMTADKIMIVRADDIKVDYEFKFEAMVVYVPPIEGESSPLLFLYASETAISGENPEVGENYGTATQSGLRFLDDGSIEWDSDAYWAITKRDDEGDRDEEDEYTNVRQQRAFIPVYRFLTASCVCFMNIQTLSYGNAKRILLTNHQPSHDELFLSLKVSLDRSQ